MTTLAKPIYPVEAAREGIEGAVNVRILVDQTGSVVRTCVLNGPEPLRKAAERAALACRFKRNFGSPGPLRGGYRTDTLAYLFVLDRARKVDEIHYIVIRPQE
jgi:TonB family protein